MRRRFGGPSFMMLTPVHPYGTDPTVPGLLGSPLPLRHTTTCGPIRLDRQFIIARMNEDPLGINPQQCTFLVANNDFSTGRAILHLGDHRLISGVDFEIGLNVNATATNIIAAVNRLGGGLAAAAGAVPNGVVVTIDDQPISKVDCRVVHYGTIVNFTTFDPDDGFMAGGRPEITAPLLAL
jgi:hypothetical protein